MRTFLSIVIAIVAAFVVGRYVTNRHKIAPPELIPMYVTPATVHVSGYTTSDGRAVSPYSRRPPGAATRDVFVNIAIKQMNEEILRPYRKAKAKAAREGLYAGLASIPITGLLSWAFLGFVIKSENKEEEA
jgi:hypothetical protein